MIEAKPTGALGAEGCGVDLSRRLTDGGLADLHAAYSRSIRLLFMRISRCQARNCHTRFG